MRKSGGASLAAKIWWDRWPLLVVSVASVVFAGRDGGIIESNLRRQESPFSIFDHPPKRPLISFSLICP